MRTHGRTILITGGGGGIGVAMARRFVAEGNRVIACGRNAATLEAAREAVPGLHVMPCDVTDLAAVDALGRHLEADFPELDMVINNAAVSRPTDMHDPDAPARIHEEVQANIMGTVHVTWRLLPLLERQPEACLAIVTSGIAYAPATEVPGYSLTKAGLHSYARALRAILRGSRVKVVEIVPPAVDTPMISRLDCRKMPPERVADRVLAGLAKDKAEIRMGQTHVTHLVNRIWPRGAELIIAGSFD